jgi:hypothetical protein
LEKGMEEEEKKIWVKLEKGRKTRHFGSFWREQQSWWDPLTRKWSISCTATKVDSKNRKVSDGVGRGDKSCCTNYFFLENMLSGLFTYTIRQMVSYNTIFTDRIVMYMQNEKHALITERPSCCKVRLRSNLELRLNSIF